VQQSRLLFIKVTEQEKVMDQLRTYRELVAERYRRSSSALQKGFLTIDAVSTDLTVLQDADSRIADLVLQISKTSHDLNALLGLSPEVGLALVGGGDLAEPDDVKVEVYIKELPRRRPDLLALQAGYDSQEQLFRKAILAQFPAVNIGIIRARDTINVYTTGVGVTLNLPIFDRNQGNIAIEKATRLRLYDEYQARLNSANSQARQVLDNLRLLRWRYKKAQEILPKLETAVNRSKSALDAGNMNITTYSDLFSALLNKRIEALTIRQNILEENVMLQTLLGADLTVHITPADIKLDKR
jgi:outer membrane protein TolC